jgi:VWFA-related protein
MARRPARPLRLALVLLVEAAVLAAGPTPQPQTPPPGSPQLPRPTFTTGVSLVTADVTVVDKDGRPVTGLSAADFSVKVDGSPRDIVTAQFVDLQRLEPTAGAKDDAPLVSNNRSMGAGRMIAFVVDQGNIQVGSGKMVLRVAEQLLDRLTPADRVSVVAVPGPGIHVSFTNDFALVREALGRISGWASRIEGSRFDIGLREAFEIDRGSMDVLRNVAGRECGAGQVCRDMVRSEASAIVAEARNRTGQSIAGIRAVLSDLVPIPGPKTVLVVSEGLPTDRPVDDLFNMGSLTARARTSIYVLRLNGTVFEASAQRIGQAHLDDAQIQASGLETLAGLASGTVFNVIGSGAGVFERVSREISGYYLIAFEPTETDRDGRPHQIKIEVNWSGVTVRSRREFTAGPAAARGTKVSDQARLGAALSSPVLLTDVPLRLTTYNFGDPASDKVRVLMAAEIGEPRTGAAGRGLAFALLDLHGRAVESGFLRETLQPRDPGAPGPLVYHGSVAVEPGDYVLKFAVANDEGDVGTVERPVHARLAEAGGLRLSDVVVGPRSGSRVFSPPTEARVHGDAFLLVELYADRDHLLDGTRVTIEVAATADGLALVSSPASLMRSSTPRRRQALADLDLSSLPPGRYVARARVDAGAGSIATATRAFVVEGGP